MQIAACLAQINHFVERLGHDGVIIYFVGARQNLALDGIDVIDLCGKVRAQVILIRLKGSNGKSWISVSLCLIDFCDLLLQIVSPSDGNAATEVLRIRQVRFDQAIEFSVVESPLATGRAVETRYNGMIHDFVLLNAIHDVAEVQAAIQQANDAIRDALKPGDEVRAALEQ